MKDDERSLCGKDESGEVVLLGPSTPLYPAPFFERGVTAVMGTWIIDLLTMLTVISEAEGTKKLHQYCGKKVAFRKKTSSIHELLINSDKKGVFALFF